MPSPVSGDVGTGAEGPGAPDPAAVAGSATTGGAFSTTGESTPPASPSAPTGAVPTGAASSGPAAASPPGDTADPGMTGLSPVPADGPAPAAPSSPGTVPSPDTPAVAAPPPPIASPAVASSPATGGTSVATPAPPTSVPTEAPSPSPSTSAPATSAPATSGTTVTSVRPALPANTAPAPASVVGVEVVGWSNVSARVVGVSSEPVCGGRTRVAVGSVAGVQAAVDAAGSGDVVVIPAGSYRGGLTVSVSGTRGCPVVIRGVDAVWASGQWSISGSHVAVRDMTFAQRHADAVRITGASVGARIHANVFESVGADTDASIDGIIKIDPAPGYDTATAVFPDIRREVLIDLNRFERSRNAVLWVWMGNQAIDFRHNLINATAMSPTRETIAIKYGSGTRSNGPQNADSDIAFNTITDWRGTPYTIGLKMPGIDVIGNLIGTGRLELRDGGNTRVIGNVFLDGDISAHGPDNTISRNWIRTTTSYYGLGGLVMQSQTRNGFTTAFTNSTVSDNVIYTTPTSDVWMPLWARAEYPDVTQRVTNNTFHNNLIAKANLGGGHGGPTLIADTGHGTPDTTTLIRTNTWTSNRLWWAGGTPTPTLGGTNTTLTTRPDTDLTPPTTRPITPTEATRPTT